MGAQKKGADGPDCTTCHFWNEGTETGDEVRWGFCNRYPPTVVASDPDTDEGVQSVQAWTVVPFWCGEHKPRLQ